MKENLMYDLLLSLSFSFFGLLLIFGLGFVFPTMNPYTAIEWIVIICAVVFFYSLVSFLFVRIGELKAIIKSKKLAKEVKKAPKAKKTSKK